MRDVRIAGLFSVLMLWACATPVPIRFTAHGPAAPIVGVSNPSFADGDPVAGRRTFLALKCNDCHRVAADPELPLGARAIAGPVLADLHRYASKDVAKRITSRSTGADQELFDRTMKDYAEPITARNLVDLVAYLRTPRVTRG